METKKIISAAVAGTSIMTLFSFFVSEVEKNNFKEPHILGILIQRLSSRQKKEVTEMEGWMIHYLVGVLFVIIYSKLWETKVLKPTVKSGLVLGALSGIPAVLVWHLTLKLHPHPPKLDLRGFYSQLVIAHIIFGAGAAIGYNFPPLRSSVFR